MGWRGSEEPFYEAKYSIEQEIKRIERDIDDQRYLNNIQNSNMKELEEIQK